MPPSTKRRPSHPAKEWGGPLRFQDVVTLSSPTKKGNPEGLPSTPSSPSTTQNHLQILSHRDAQQLGVDSDNGSEFINYHLLAWCQQRELTFTRSRPGNSNDGAHVEQKNWAVVRTVVGYHRYDTPAELRLLNKIWVLQSLMTNYFLPQQKLVSKVRDGENVTKKYDRPTTPYRRAEHPAVTQQDKKIMEATLAEVNPAAVQRQNQALIAELLTLTTSKAAARSKPQIQPPTTRASVHESTKRATRAS